MDSDSRFGATMKAWTAILIVVVLAACGADRPKGERAGSPPIDGSVGPTGYLADQVPNPQASTIGVPTRLTDLLPNRLVPATGGGTYTYVQSVVIADVVSVRPERATVWSHLEGDDETPEVVEFEDGRAESRTWMIELSVEEVVAGPSPEQVLKTAGPNQLLRFVTRGGPIDVDRFISEMEKLDGSLWFLKTRRTWSDALDSAWMGRSVALVDRDGRLTFPLLGSEASKFLHADGVTLDDLRTLAAKPNSVIEELRQPG